MSINDIFDIIFGFLMPGNGKQPVFMILRLNGKKVWVKFHTYLLTKNPRWRNIRKQGQKLKSRYLRNQLRYWNEIWPAFISH